MTAEEKPVEFTIEDLQRAESELAAASAELIEGSLYTPDHILVDLGLLKDLRMGAAIVALHDQGRSDEEINTLSRYMIDNILPYVTRHFSDIPKFFPKLGVTNDELDALYADTSRHDEIFLFAPVMQFVNTFNSNLQVNANHSHVGERYTKKPVRKGFYRKVFKPITVYVNTFPLVLSPRAKSLTGRFLADAFGVTAVVFCDDYETMSASDFTKFNEIDTINLSPILRNEKLRSAFENQKCQNMKIYAPAIYGDRSLPGYDDATANAEAVHIAARLNFLSDFKWIEPQHLGPFIPAKVAMKVMEEQTNVGK